MMAGWFLTLTILGNQVFVAQYTMPGACYEAATAIRNNATINGELSCDRYWTFPFSMLLKGTPFPKD